MRFTIISGSQRSGSQSTKVALFLQKRLASLVSSADSYHLDLANNPLPLWDESIWDKPSPWDEGWQPIAAQLQKSDAVIWVVPEWNGMLPSGVINLLHLCGPKELGHKPALIVSISASRNGAYPVAQMRMNTAKNNRLLYIPEHLIIRDVEKMLNGEEPSSEDDAYIRRRMDYCLRLLASYGEALQGLRHSSVIDHQSFPSGM